MAVRPTSERVRQVLAGALAVLLSATLAACGAPGADKVAEPEAAPASEQAGGSQEAASEPEGRAEQSEPAADKGADADADKGADKNATPFAAHGALAVKGGQLVDSHGEPFQLRGVSTHGLAWFPQFVDAEGFRTLRDDWRANCVRLAMYSGENGGYATDGDPAALEALVDKGVTAASDLGLYVVVDWHVLGDQDPLVHKDRAVAFFDKVSERYADKGNVVYEICNEPNGSATWGNVTAYANEVIPVIRANDPDAVVIVGTPTWSQDIDQAQAAPLAFDNVLYAVHFYAATHGQWLRDRVDEALKAGLPVIVSEYGLCDASGSGGNDYQESAAWLDFLDEHRVSYIAWSLCDKDETSALVAPGTGKTSGWGEAGLSESGRWVREQYRERAGR